VSMSARS